MESIHKTPLGSPESEQRRKMIHHIVAATLHNHPETRIGVEASDEWERLFSLDSHELQNAFNSAELVLNTIDEQERLTLLNRALTFGQ